MRSVVPPLGTHPCPGHQGSSRTRTVAPSISPRKKQVGCRSELLTTHLAHCCRSWCVDLESLSATLLGTNLLFGEWRQRCKLSSSMLADSLLLSMELHFSTTCSSAKLTRPKASRRSTTQSSTTGRHWRIGRTYSKRRTSRRSGTGLSSGMSSQSATHASRLRQGCSFKHGSTVSNHPDPKRWPTTTRFVKWWGRELQNCEKGDRFSPTRSSLRFGVDHRVPAHWSTGGAQSGELSLTSKKD